MTIATYSDLLAAVENWLARTDQSGRTPEFIALAEAEINRRLDIREMESRATAATTPGTGYIALPTNSANFIMLRRLQYAHSGGVIVLSAAAPHQLAWEYPSNATGMPRGYAVVGSEIQLRPVPDAAYTLEATYLNRIAALSGTNVPVLFTNNPDLWLYGALKHAIPYINEPDAVGRFEQFRVLFEEAIMQTKVADMRGRHGGAPLTIRSDVGNP